jgi:predicted ATP-dependent endonuclease of OLD family
MLDELELENFRCFKRHSIKFNKFNILVGKNNSGKSTVIDALKLISNAVRFSPYREVTLNEKDIPFPIENIRYNYTEDDSKISARFSDGTEVEVVFPLKGLPFSNILNSGENIKNKILKEKIIGIVPPVHTFEKTEELGNPNYIRSIMSSHLASRHFRNIWNFSRDGFEEFKEILEKTWPGYTIFPPEFRSEENIMNMFFREYDSQQEIYWAGHGFQIWLQLITFLVKLGKKETLVLDEPDIYLHPDMQKKLVDICRSRSNQIIMATHAVDIIESVEVDDIISIDKLSDQSVKLSTIDEVQTCIDQLGSSQNLKLINFVKGKTCLFVEGNDFIILKKLSKKFNSNFNSEEGFSVIQLQGFSNWSRLLHVNWIFKNVLGEKVKCYVLLDRDYYPQAKIDEITSALIEKKVKVHVWHKKEIENYLINFGALYRIFLIKYEFRNGSIPCISFSEFSTKLLIIIDELKNDTSTQLLAYLIKNKQDSSIDVSTIIKEFTIDFEKQWKEIDFRKNVISGKEFFSILNRWLSNEYRMSLSISFVINQISSEEIDKEILNTIDDFMSIVDGS